MPITEQYILVCKINYAGHGWTEKYWLSQTSHAAAEPVAKELCHRRRSFFGVGVEMVWARISQDGGGRDSQMVDCVPLGSPYPAADIVNPNHPEDPFTALTFRFEAGQGRWAYRSFRGIPDSLVKNFKRFPIGQDAYTPVPADAALLPITEMNNRNARDHRKHFLRYLLENTVHVRVDDSAAPTEYEQTQWTRCLPRKVSRKNTGLPFGLSRGRSPSLT